MNIFDKLEIQYTEIDKQYSDLEINCSRRRWYQKEHEYIKKRKLNDQAYFLFMFTRLEDKISQESAKLIKRKKESIQSWKQKVPWDILHSDKMTFKNKLPLLTEKGNTDYNLVIEYYDERNSIAHGGNFIKGVIIPNVIIELKRLYKILKA